MLRYFYILICMPLCFCYEYIETNQQFRKRNENSKIENSRRERNKVVNFDVASFLKNTATEKLQDYEPFGYRNRNRDRRTQSEYYYDSPLNENIEKTNENANYFNIDTNPDIKDRESRPTKNVDSFDYPQIIGDITNESKMKVSSREKPKNKQNRLHIDNDLIANPEKKCAFKNMKVPFFSHKITAKKQKRKLLCFNCDKKYVNKPIKSEDTKMKKILNKIKQTYGNLCPKCIKQILLKRKNKTPEKTSIIHNSRQYYQGMANQETMQTVKRHTIVENYYTKPTGRLKRNDVDEHERRLMELAEVEKKINQVKITTPKFERFSMKNYDSPENGGSEEA